MAKLDLTPPVESGQEEKLEKQEVLPGTQAVTQAVTQAAAGQLKENLNLKSLIDEFKKLTLEIKKLRYPTYVKDGDKVSIFYPDNGRTESIDVRIQDKEDIRGKEKGYYSIFLNDNWDSFKYISCTWEGYIENPDTNLVDKVLSRIKEYIDECKSYQDKKEKEEQEFPSVVKYKKLYDKLLKLKIKNSSLKGENYSLEFKNNRGYKIELTATDKLCTANTGDESIFLQIEGHDIHFYHNWIDWKFTLDWYWSEFYVLNEKETKEVLDIVEKLIKRDKTINFESLPPRYLDFYQKTKERYHNNNSSGCMDMNL